MRGGRVRPGRCAPWRHAAAAGGFAGALRLADNPALRPRARVVELVDAGDSKSPAARLVGSSPTSGTTAWSRPRAPAFDRRGSGPRQTAAAGPPPGLGLPASSLRPCGSGPTTPVRPRRSHRPDPATPTPPPRLHRPASTASAPPPRTSFRATVPARSRCRAGPGAPPRFRGFAPSARNENDVYSIYPGLDAAPARELPHTVRGFDIA